MDNPIWTLKDVTLQGDSGPRVDSLTADIANGVTAVIGYSGAGKTSLLNLLAGMDKPDAGQVTFRLPQAATSEFSLSLYWVPQDGGLWPHLTALQHLSAVVEHRGGVDVGPLIPVDSRDTGRKSGQNDENSGDKLLRLFDLQHRAGAYPSELSQGEQSRLAVARCLAARPAVMLMDEPLAHTDPVRRPRYWELIRGYLQTSGASLVFTTHEPEATIRESRKVICLKEGKMIFSGTTLSLYRSPPNEEAAQFLGPVTSLSTEECETWLGLTEDIQDGLFLRPEMFELTPDVDGPFEILSFQFCGSYAETKLKHIPTTTKKTITHRPVGKAISVGGRVRMQMRKW